MIPAKIMIEIPFPIPFSVICSPIQIKKAVPATIDIITTDFCKNVCASTAFLKIPNVNPIA